MQNAYANMPWVSFLCKIFTETLTPEQCPETKETCSDISGVRSTPVPHHHPHKGGHNHLLDTSQPDRFEVSVLALSFRQLHAHPFVANDCVAHSIVVE